MTPVADALEVRRESIGLAAWYARATRGTRASVGDARDDRSEQPIPATPDERYPSLGELLDALEQALEDEARPAAAATTAGAATAAAPASHRPFGPEPLQQPASLHPQRAVHPSGRPLRGRLRRGLPRLGAMPKRGSLQGAQRPLRALSGPGRAEPPADAPVAIAPPRETGSHPISEAHATGSSRGCSASDPESPPRSTLAYDHADRPNSAATQTLHSSAFFLFHERITTCNIARLSALRPEGTRLAAP